ncbi:MAG TPA: PIN domain-containing protein [Gammaproteobacteria bacterium]|nr:PIN domain-containing protein [Gammaproteobacteria bacterium]
MNARYVLIDYENVQPKDLALLDGQPVHVIVFLGANQKSVPADLAMALQARGANGQYVQINANGRNALDLHIAFHIGELAAKDPSASFHVISKDGDYDPLLRHLKSRGIEAQRSATLASLVPVPPDRVERAIAYLQNPSTKRPRTMKSLANALNTHLGGKLESPEIDVLIAELERRDIISVADGKVA